ncbi:proton-coupled amino acid transporter-like protein CG1139 [Anopheles ziemanni]|uniref:proton-coupled amino acid transporter-like protein CG1139 n=1 Tax=Anopheles coustani TaxID=139045 RepID=UPI002658F357|nr:proton-coupled amino acid transporter-like protein CG1139 [Anopheles coustani]XP_058170107.1 proton-coupled amino acid transporter-like protein CG1139 [Anopheles ziemanni]
MGEEKKNYLFNGANFNNWSFRMEILLEELDLLDCIRVESDKVEEYKVLETDTAAEKLAKELKLRDRQKKDVKCKKGISGQFYILKKLSAMKFSESGSLQAHLLEFERMVRDLAAAGIQLQESLQYSMASTEMLAKVSSTGADGQVETAPEKDYDPYQHRIVDKPTSTIGTFMHVIKGAMGVGILSMPYAIRNGGLVFGVIGTFLLGLLYSHCVHLLVGTAYKICKRDRVPMLTYAQTVDRAFALGPVRTRPLGKNFKTFIDYYLMIALGPMIYMVFVGTTLHGVINSSTDLDWDVRIYILLAAIPAIVITQVREIKYLVPFSAIATTLIITNVVISLNYIFREPLSTDDRNLFPTFSSVAKFLGTAYLAFDATVLIFPISNQMKTPQHYLGCPGIVNVNNICLAFLYSFFGLMGYLRYGDAIQGSITLNFPTEEKLALIIQVLSAVAILFSIGIYFYVPQEIIWRKLHRRVKPQWHMVVQSFIRLLYLAVIVGIACGIPDIGTFVGIIGSMFNPILALWFPILVDTVYRWPSDFGWMKWRLVKNFLMGVFGSFLMITGTISSVKDIIELYD